MTRKVCWKKGMRLTDEILTASDVCHVEMLGKAVVLASAGRFGLFPGKAPFEISVSINKNILHVDSLHCLAVAKNGEVIDIGFDTNFTSSFEASVAIPDTEEKTLYLAVAKQQNEWRDTNDGYCEPVYSFHILPENSVLPVNSFPVARIVDEFGWRMDDLNFVPPCLYVSSHPYFCNLVDQFSSILDATNQYLEQAVSSDCKTVISVFWPIVQQLKIIMNKDIDLMTPMSLLGNVQKFVSAFFCGCRLDAGIDLTGPEEYGNYLSLSYNYKEVYSRVKEGLELCIAIRDKVEKFKDFTPRAESIEAPTISKSNLIKRCTNSKVRIPVENNCPGAIIYYTTDGTDPSEHSNKGDTIVLTSGFVGGRDKEEKDRTVVVKVKAVLNGISSVTNTYKITLQKDIKHWIEI